MKKYAVPFLLAVTASQVLAVPPMEVPMRFKAKHGNDSTTVFWPEKSNFMVMPTFGNSSPPIRRTPLLSNLLWPLIMIRT